MRTHFSITQASLITATGAIVTAAVAIVPSWKPYQEAILSGIGTVISTGFLLANALHAKAAAIQQSPTVQVAPAPDPTSALGRAVEQQIAETVSSALADAFAPKPPPNNVTPITPPVS